MRVDIDVLWLSGIFPVILNECHFSKARHGRKGEITCTCAVPALYKANRPAPNIFAAQLHADLVLKLSDGRLRWR